MQGSGSSAVPPGDGPLVSTLYEEAPELAYLAEKFIARLPGLIDDIAASVSARNWAGLQQQAHDLKGMGGGHGFPPVTAAAARLEREAMAQNHESAQHRLEELRRLERRILAGRRQGAGSRR